MSVKIVKEKFNCLKLHALVSDTKYATNDKFLLKVENNETKIFQYSSDVYVITDIGIIENQENFETCFPVNEFRQIVNLIDDNEIIIEDNSILKFGSNSRYNLPVMDIDFQDIFDTYNFIKENKSIDNFKIVDLKKISMIKNYIGEDESGLEAIQLKNSNFIASNRTDVTGIIKTENNSDNEFFLSKTLVNIINQFDLSEIEINIMNEDISYIKVMDSIIIFKPKELCFPDFFDEEIRQKYDHKDKIIINKNQFQKVLQRMLISSKDNLYQGINLTIEKDNLIIENRNSAVEKISIKANKDFSGYKFRLSSRYLYQIADTLEGEEIFMHIEKPSPDIPAISFKDCNDNKIFIHVLYEDIEEEGEEE